jgi:cellulose biosynthesis protein BcsQ
MKMITCCSFKGGAGKTTALMAMSSAMALAGHRIALLEADENRPLSRWKNNATAQDSWDERIDVFVADEIAALEAAYAEAEGAGYDFAIADTHGGSSELNNTIIASSDFLLLPTMLTALDIDEALATYRYVVELMVAENLDIPTAVLKQRVPVGRLTLSQMSSAQLLSELPQFDDPMHERDAYAAMKQRGLLHRTIERIANNPAMRLQLRNHQAAMEEAGRLAAFVTTAMEA